MLNDLVLSENRRFQGMQIFAVRLGNELVSFPLTYGWGFDFAKFRDRNRAAEFLDNLAYVFDWMFAHGRTIGLPIVNVNRCSYAFCG